MFQYIDIYCNW